MPAIKETFLLAEEPEAKSTKQARKNDSAQRMLDWLQRWSEPTVSVRDIRIWGPRIFRDPKEAIASAQTLVKFGWLTPIGTRQPYLHKWRVIRKMIVNPKIAT
jgi:hypothetical protein